MTTYQEFTQEEAKEFGAFAEDVLNEQDAISATYNPYGDSMEKTTLPSGITFITNGWL